MSDFMRAFDDHAAEWEDYTQTPTGRLRELLNWRYLEPHLPPRPATVLDVGAGTGGLGIYLAQVGYTTHLLDLSSKMLDIAAQKADQHGLYFTLHHADIATFSPPPDGFDVICCHTVLAYVPDPAAALHQMATWLKPNGILSLAFVNRHADVLKAALGKGNWRSAQAQLSVSSASADLFGVSRKIYDAETMLNFLDGAGLQPIAEYGVRIFTDYNSHTQWQSSADDFEALVALEIEAAPQRPYHRIGRYGQIIARVAAQ